MTITELPLELTALNHTWRDETPGWTYADGQHVDRRGNTLRVVAVPTNERSATATVLYNGLAMLAVIGDLDTVDDDRHMNGWRWAWPTYWVEPEDIRHWVRFNVTVVEELGIVGMSEDETVDQIMRSQLGAVTLDAIFDEFGGEGHGVVAFTGLVARALHEAYPTLTPAATGW